MKKLILLAAASALSTSASAQTRAPDPARLKATVEKLVRFGTRHTLSSATDPKRGIGAARRWGGAEFETISINQIDAPDAVLVATGSTGLESATNARVMRIDDPSGDMSRKTLATIAANDRLKPEETVKTTADAMVTDADGFGYVLGTTSGDLGSQRLAGDQDLYLTKMDSLGNVVWQHSLGAAGSASRREHTRGAACAAITDTT